MHRDDLLQRAQRGEQDALVALVERYQSYVYSVALSVTRNSADAADMTQETFVRVFRTLPTYRGNEAQLTTWLFRLTTNICLDGLRRRGRPVASLEASRAQFGTDLDWRPAGAAPTRWEQPEERLAARETAREVRSAMLRLPASQRATLVLHYFEDLSYEQVAVALGLPLNTVKSHIHRGKHRLASLLNRTPIAVAA